MHHANIQFSNFNVCLCLRLKRRHKKKKSDTYFGKAALLLSYFSALIEKLMKKKNCIKLVNIGFPKKMQSSSSVG